MAALKSRGVKIVVLTNSGRTGEANARRMTSLGFGPELYDFLITSGDVARNLLKTGHGPVPIAKDARCFTIASDDSDEFASALGMSSIADSGDADLAIIGGSQADRVSLEDYRKLPKPSALRGAPRVCESRQTHADGRGECARARSHRGDLPGTRRRGDMDRQAFSRNFANAR